VRFMTICVILNLIIASAPAVAKNPYVGKKLIQYGAGTPETAQLREQVRDIEKVPFDGIVISVKSETKRDILGWRTFSTVRFAPEEYEHAITDLKGTKFERLTDNFIQMIAMPGDVDWFDPEWSAIAHNAACLAKVAKQGGCKGIMLDPEDYVENHLWNYDALPLEKKAAHSLHEYLARVEERGKEFIRAINKEYPEITILFLIGPSCTYENAKKIRHDGGGGMYQMLSAFCDGICEAATPGTTLIDGYEQGYGFRELAQFEKGRKITLELTKDGVSLNPKAYAKHVRAGFPVWADSDSGARGWHPDDFSKNYYTPEQLRAVVAYALQTSDKYVWVYQQSFVWWSPEMPKAYIGALRLARSGPGVVRKGGSENKD